MADTHGFGAETQARELWIETLGHGAAPEGPGARPRLPVKVCHMGQAEKRLEKSWHGLWCVESLANSTFAVA